MSLTVGFGGGNSISSWWFQRLERVENYYMPTYDEHSQSAEINLVMVFSMLISHVGCLHTAVCRSQG